MSAPIVTVFKNGDAHFPGKKIVVSHKFVRDFDSFLDSVTRDIRAKVAVRSIRTPNHGTRVLNLEKLKNGGVYVATGPEKFKKIQYHEITPFHVTLQSKAHDLQPTKSLLSSRVHASARCLKVAATEPQKIRVIHVYRNGDDKHPGVRILLHRWVLQDWDNVLQFITNKINLRTGAVKSLYDLDGCEVLDGNEIQSGSKYVAVGYGKPFVKMDYPHVDMSNLSPRRLTDDAEAKSGASDYGKELKQVKVIKAEKHSKRETSDISSKRFYPNQNAWAKHMKAKGQRDQTSSTSGSDNETSILRKTLPQSVLEKVEDAVHDAGTFSGNSERGGGITDRSDATEQRAGDSVHDQTRPRHAAGGRHIKAASPSLATRTEPGEFDGNNVGGSENKEDSSDKDRSDVSPLFEDTRAGVRSLKSGMSEKSRKVSSSTARSQGDRSSFDEPDIHQGNMNEHHGQASTPSSSSKPPVKQSPGRHRVDVEEDTFLQKEAEVYLSNVMHKSERISKIIFDDAEEEFNEPSKVHDSENMQGKKRDLAFGRDNSDASSKFKASGFRREKAVPVRDTADTRIEKTIDMRHADPVDDEDLLSGNDPNNSNM